MIKSRPKRDSGADRDWPSRPEDPDTQRLKRSKLLLRKRHVARGAAMVTQAEDERDSETAAPPACDG
jgi:hypothetical protein